MVRLWRTGKDGVTAGVLYWTYKKPGNARGDLVTVPWTPGWDAVAHYLQDGGPVAAERLRDHAGHGRPHGRQVRDLPRQHRRRLAGRRGA